MSLYRYRPLETDSLRTRSLKGRPSKVDLAAFARAYRKGEGLQGWMGSLPRILAGTDFRDAVDALERARRKGRAMVWGLGGHVVKCGLNAVIIDLMQRGFVSALALNGATAIHDFEIALAGATSEEVERDLAEGDFGVSEETGREMNAAVARGAREDKGIGQALGEWILERPADFPHAGHSLLACALQRKVPVTVHVALGTDTTHYHPSADGEALGRGSMQDFRLLASIARDLHDGGVYLNCGSAVILPEVFLKAVNLVRNLGHPLEAFTTVNLDFLQHYRPTRNVVQRPTLGSGKGIALTGHHELMIPLLAAALVERDQE